MRTTLTPWIKAAWLPTLITLGMAALAAMPGLSAALELRLDAPSPLFTLLTGHFVHHSWRHFLYDAAVFVALGSVAARQHGARAVLWTTLGTALAVSLLLPVVAPQFASYRGISAVDTALVAWVAWDLCRDTSRLLRVAAMGTLAGIMLKSGYEMVFARNLFVTDTGFAPVAAAHLVGAVCGILSAVCTNRVTALVPIGQKLPDRLRLTPEGTFGKFEPVTTAENPDPVGDAHGVLSLNAGTRTSPSALAFRMATSAGEGSRASNCMAANRRRGARAPSFRHAVGSPSLWLYKERGQ